MGRYLGLGLLVFGCLAAAACSSKHNTFSDGAGLDGGDDTTDGGGGGNPPTPEGGFGNSTDGGGNANNADCNADTQDIYVVADDATLYSFVPTTLTFSPVGHLSCANAGGATPTSMGVDRQGNAWVLFSDGSVNKVDVKTAACTGTMYVPGQSGFTHFGMGFSTDTASSTSETLFLSDHDGKGLAKLDLTSFKLTTIGEYTGVLKGQTSELTGTGDGRLFGFFTTSPATVAEINKTTGAILSQQTLADTYAGTAWAFSFYAGDFYVYTADNSGGGLPLNGTGTDVTRYRPSDGTVTIVKPKIGFTIVGAGVSTCVPTTGVK